MMMSTFLCCDSTHVHWLSHCMCIVLYVCEVLFVVASVCCDVCKGVFIATQLNSTQLNWTQLTQLNSVQPSQSCFCLWRHDLQTESTGSLIGDSCSRCEPVDNSTSSWVELSCVAINGPLTCCDATLQSRLFLSHVTGNAYVTFRIDQH